MTSIGQNQYDEDRGVHQVSDAGKGVKPLSFPQLRLLKCLRDGEPINSHCNSQSDYGGLATTRYSLQQRGYITWDCEITEMGLNAILREELRAQKKSQKRGS